MQVLVCYVCVCVYFAWGSYTHAGIWCDCVRRTSVIYNEDDDDAGRLLYEAAQVPDWNLGVATNDTNKNMRHTR